ncbi:MAG TPA: phosphatidylcholine/phosphatidylserine synthase [Terriglobales bacterium]|nr:phosphatidylcholine/phosphatidylserine synthase [Terriglobales bacterium]
MQTAPFPQPVPAVPRRRPRKGMYLLPGLFTTANLAFGYYAISQVLMAQANGNPAQNLDQAAKAIGFAILFDGFDGRIARMTGTSSEFGKQLDSLADAITFGVAPALLAWVWGIRLLPQLADAELQVRLAQFGAIATFLFLVAGVSRLARFNIQINPQPSNPGRPGKKYFVGMPIPAGAGVVAATVHLSGGVPLTEWWISGLWLLLVVSLAFLMVSTWRFYSSKDIDLRRQRPFRNIVFLGLLFAAIWFYSRYVLFVMALAYMISGLLWRLQYLFRRSGTTPEHQHQPSPVR